jgi:hypothetical protein
MDNKQMKKVPFQAFFIRKDLPLYLASHFRLKLRPLRSDSFFAKWIDIREAENSGCYFIIYWCSLKLLAPFGANSTQRQLSWRLCVDTGQTGGVTGQTGRRENSGGRPANVAQARSRQGDARRVSLGSARPPRAPSDVAETKGEQQVVDWKNWEEVKVNTRQIKVKRFDRLDDEPQSAVAPYIYKVGRSCPARKFFYKPNLSGVLNLAQNRGGAGLTGEGHRSDRSSGV